MALKTMKPVTLEVQSAWGMMVVGPIRDGDIALRPEDRVCRVPQGIFSGAPVSTREPEDEESDIVSNSVSPLVGAVNGSSFYFGTDSIVMEQDEKSLKCWVREGNLRDGVGWLKYERRQD